jgi:molecular chaperone DnaJ
MADASTGYVRVQEFSKDSPVRIKQAFESLAKTGASRYVIDLRGNARGDLIVEVIVETPAHLDDAQRDLLKQLAAARDETAPEARLGQTQRSVFGRIRDKLR